jgi:hypothetical protein
VRGAQVLSSRPGEEWKDFKGIITMVLIKRDDKWLIRAVQNTVSSPPPKPER